MSAKNGSFLLKPVSPSLGLLFDSSQPSACFLIQDGALYNIQRIIQHFLAQNMPALQAMKCNDKIRFQDARSAKYANSCKSSVNHSLKIPEYCCWVLSDLQRIKYCKLSLISPAPAYNPPVIGPSTCKQKKHPIISPLRI